LHGLESVLTAGFTSFGGLEYRGRGLNGDERLDHRATVLAVPVSGADIPPEASISEHLVPPMIYRRQHASESLPLLSDQA
jgi:hypothetical protein